MRFVQFLFFRHALARDFSLEPIIYDIWWRFSPPNSESGGTFCPRSGNIAKIAPISTVIPIILLATVDTSFRKNGHKKQISPDMKKAPTISD